MSFDNVSQGFLLSKKYEENLFETIDKNKIIHNILSIQVKLYIFPSEKTV